MASDTYGQEAQISWKEITDEQETEGHGRCLPFGVPGYVVFGKAVVPGGRQRQDTNL